MASDSRQSVTIQGKAAEGKEFNLETVNSDAVHKTFLLPNGIGVSNFGQDLLGGRPMGSHIKRFSEESLKQTDDVESTAKKISEFFEKEFNKPDVGFHVSGYKKDGKVSIPYVYYIQVKANVLDRKNINEKEEVVFGCTWAGQPDIIQGLINSVVVKDQTGQEKVLKQVPPIIWDAMPLQDAIDFSIFAIRTTIDTMRFQARPKNVGGPIDVLLITPDETRWLKHKELGA